MTAQNETKNVKTLQEIWDEQGPRDNSAMLERLWAIQCGWRDQVLAKVELTLDPETDDIRSYETDDGAARGELFSYRGPKIDYFVNSWIGNPALGFTNIHFNLWVAPEYKIPHLGIVFGTIPDLFFYADFASRVDMVEHTDYLDKYFAPANDDYLGMREVAGLTEFTSIDPYIRLSKSPVACGFSSEITDENIDRFAALGQKYLDQWFEWIADPELTPKDEIEAVRRRDIAHPSRAGSSRPGQPDRREDVRSGEGSASAQRAVGPGRLRVIQPDDGRWTVEVDVAVVGAGGCGLAAALAAAEAGLTVFVFEKMAVPLPNTARSTGMIPAAGTRWQRAAGDRGLAEVFAARHRGEDARHRRPRAGPAAHHGVGRARGVARRRRHGASSTWSPASPIPGHSRERMHAPADRAGTTVMRSLRRAVEAAGVEVVLDAPATGLIVDADGRVTGLVVQHGDDVERVRATSVVLASNGFGANREMLLRALPRDRRRVVPRW